MTDQLKVTLGGDRPPLATPFIRLRCLSDLFAQRNTAYGDSYLQFGPLAVGMFPDGLTLSTADEWNRFALFFMLLLKLHRYGMRFNDGGQEDSLNDLSVYAQMLAYVDSIQKEKEDEA